MALDDEDDETLAHRAAAGDESAFDALASRHIDRVYAIALKWCSGNRADAEDITQEVFLKLARNIHHYKPAGRFTTWLYQVVVNEARDSYRREKARRLRETLYEKETAKTEPSAEEAREKREEKKGDKRLIALYDMLKRLSPEQREAVVLVFCHGMSHREAAKVLGCAEKTVTWRLFEAKKKLREWYGNG
jgi:RNA polymerase sigma-70 factor (ECF subfamily)